MNRFLIKAFTLFLSLVIISLVLFYAPVPQSAETINTDEVWIRYNKVGYPAGGEKRLVVVWRNNSNLISNRTIWTLGTKSGNFANNSNSDGGYLPSGFKFKEVPINVDECDKDNAPCTHDFRISGVANSNVQIKVYKKGKYPYDTLISEALRHFRIHRNSSDLKQEFNLSPGHPQDGNCQVFKPTVGGEGTLPRVNSDDNSNNWTSNGLPANHNMSGGWYDAGDYHKFTHTIAYSTYVMLRALEVRNSNKNADKTVTNALSNEAQFGLDYLSRTVRMNANGNPDYFIIQVGDDRDHTAQANRPLPGNDDRLDDETDKPIERRCYAAFSPPQMAYTAAALSLGGRLFGNNNHNTQANAIFNRIGQGPNRRTDLEFYSDDDATDNLRMAEAEIMGRIDREPLVSLNSVDYQTSEILALMNINADTRVRVGNASNSTRTTLGNAINSRLTSLRDRTNNTNNVWKIPVSQDNQRLYRMFGPGFIALRPGLGRTPEKPIAYNVLNYLLGLNNWDVGFMKTSLCANCNNSPTYDAIYRIAAANTNGIVNANGAGEIYQGGIPNREDKCFKNENNGGYNSNEKRRNCATTSSSNVRPFDTPLVRFHFKDFNDQTVESSIWGESLAILLLTALKEDDQQ